jgi:O-antigen/teichoic acid export membrane protein
MSASACTTAQTARLSVGANFCWTLGGNLAQAGSQWMLFVILARLASPELVGAYALSLAVASPVFLMANLHLRTVLATDVAGEYSFDTYLVLRLISSGAAASILFACSVAFRDGTGGGILAALAIHKLMESLSELLYGRFQLRERMAQIGRSMILRAAGVMVALTIMLKTGAGVVAGFWACTLVAAVVFALDAVLLIARDMACGGWPDPDWRKMRVLVRQVAPLSLVLLLVSLNANTPRYILAALSGDREVGVFSALAALSVAANTLVMALGQTSGTRMALSFLGRDLAGFVRRSGVMLMTAAAIGAAGITVAFAAGSQLLGAVYGPGYAGSVKSFRWVMIGGALSYIGAAAGYVMSSARCFTPQLPLLAGVTLVTAASCFLLVPGRGIEGAAMGQAGGYLVQSLASLLILRHWCRRQFAR